MNILEVLVKLRDDLKTWTLNLFNSYDAKIESATSTKMDKTNPSGTGSFSLNRKSGTTVGNYSTAEGYNTTATGSYTHAEGYNTTASSSYAHAEGYNTIASGMSSHAEGSSSESRAYYSHAENRSVAASQDQHTQGRFNIIDSSGKYAHIVGNGSGTSYRSNAHTLDWDGNAWFAGDVSVGSEQEKLVKKSEIIDPTVLVPGAITWDRVVGDKEMIIVGSDDNLTYGYVKVGEPIGTIAEAEMLLDSGVVPLIGLFSTEDGFHSAPCITEWESNEQDKKIALFCFPEDGSADLGAIFVFENYLGVPPGIYFGFVAYMNTLIIGAITNLQIPGFGVSSSAEDKNYETHTIKELNQVLRWTNQPAAAYVVFNEALSFSFHKIGNCQLTYEQLLNTKIYFCSANNQLDTNVRITQEDSYTSVSCDFGGIYIIYDNVDMLDGYEVTLTPGVYAMSLNVRGISLTKFSYVAFDEMVESEQIVKSLSKEVLPEHLQFGEVELEHFAVVAQPPIQIEGDILYKDPDRETSMGLLTSGTKSRAADYIEIPEDTEIIATITDSGQSQEFSGPGRISGNRIEIDMTNCSWFPYGTGWYQVGTIGEAGIYICDSGTDPMWYKTKSIQFKGMSFTYTEYTGEFTAETVFKTLDEKYLPDTVATKEYIDIRVPAWTDGDEGKILQIINGAPAWVSIPAAESSVF